MRTLCPCGSNRSADVCCEAIIRGQREAVTAEELMRSRYVAFTLANGDYLMTSQHPRTRKIREKKAIEQWAASVHWAGLTILGKEKGEATDPTGIVEFRALYIENGTLQQIHERSTFERVNGKWVYVSGDHLSS